MRPSYATSAALLALVFLALLMPSCSSDDDGTLGCDVANTASLTIINRSAMTDYNVAVDGAGIGIIQAGDQTLRVLSAGVHTVQFFNPDGSEACTNPVTLVTCQVSNTVCNADPLPCQQQQFGEWTFINASANVDYRVDVDGNTEEFLPAGDQSNPKQLSPGLHDVEFVNTATDQVSCSETIDVDVCEQGQSSCNAP